MRLLQFVDAPELDAEIRLDLNDPVEGVWIGRDGIDFGAAEFLGSPGGVGGEYGYRQIQVGLRVVTDNHDAAARVQSLLARELARPSNWLAFQAETSAPQMWFRTWQSTPAAVSLRLHEQGVWDVAFTVDADPHAVGERVTHEVTVGNDPATGGLVTVLPDIRGDAPAPLVIELSAGDSTYVQPWISVCPLEQARTWLGPVFWQAESGTLTGDATLQPASGNNSGGTRVRLAFNASVSSERRMTATVTPPFAGRWRVWARFGFYMQTAGDADVTVRGAGSAVSQPRKTVLSYSDEPADAQYRFVDLGIYTFPKGNLPTRRPYSLGAGGIGVDVAVTTAGGATGAVFVDYILAVPVDLPLDAAGVVTTLDFRQRAQTKGTPLLRLNGEESAVQEETAGVLEASNPETPAGEYPKVTPGAQNVLTLLTRRTLVGTSLIDYDRVTSTTALSVSYRPRWTYLPGL